MRVVISTGTGADTKKARSIDQRIVTKKRRRSIKSAEIDLDLHQDHVHDRIPL